MNKHVDCTCKNIKKTWSEHLNFDSSNVTKRKKNYLMICACTCQEVLSGRYISIRQYLYYILKKASKITNCFIFCIKVHTCIHVYGLSGLNKCICIFNNLPLINVRLIYDMLLRILLNLI